MKKKLTEIESKVLDICHLWLKLIKEIFPNEKPATKLPIKGNITKCFLFKCCWKMYRETKGLLEEKDFEKYIKAQLIIIKMHKEKESVIFPNILCGDKAWIRWKVFKKMLEQAQNKPLDFKEKVSQDNLSLDMIKNLAATQKFIYEKCEGNPTIDKFYDFYTKKLLKKWIDSRKLCQEYVVLSPFMEQILGENIKKMNFYSIKELINSDIINYFRKEFNYEYS